MAVIDLRDQGLIDDPRGLCHDGRYDVGLWFWNVAYNAGFALSRLVTLER
ncbi:hypothetical protein [Luedemannella helvata]|uniref:Uncharacterized protein n=1 Tax=Luedemannella helvata TaxID=349315 RepID=A0ABP4WNW6_9ACTN